MSIKVLIADDYPILRYDLTAYLDRQPGPCGWGILRMGIKSCRRSKGPALHDLENPPTVLIFSAYSDPDKVLGLVRGGARGYLLKNIQPDQILKGIRAVAWGQAWFCPNAKAALAKDTDRGDFDFKRDLSDRELEVLKLAAKGHSNRQIAMYISISERIVRFHMEKILEKLKVSNRTEAVALAFQKVCKVKWKAVVKHSLICSLAGFSINGRLMNTAMHGPTS